eukprot:1845-Amphidinium_carterae.1
MQLSLTPLLTRADCSLPTWTHDRLQPAEVPLVHLVERSEHGQPLDRLVVNQTHQFDLAEVVQDALRPVVGRCIVASPPEARVVLLVLAVHHEQPIVQSTAG